MRKCGEYTYKNKEGLKVLLINPFGIGDVLFSTPLIEDIKRELPRSRICYICNKRTVEVLEKCPDLERVFVFEKGDYRELWKKNRFTAFKNFFRFLGMIRRERFDLAIDMSMGHQYSLFLALIGVPLRVGFNYKGRGRFLTDRIEFDGFNDRPIGEYYKDLLRTAGFKCQSAPTHIWWDKDDEIGVDNFFNENGLTGPGPIIGITPGGGVSFGVKNIAFKRWPARRFAELADLITGRLGGKVILIWGPQEEGLVEEILRLAKADILIAPKTTIREMAALMSKCDCVVCNDSGPLHVAVAAGTKTVSIFGPSDESVYGPYPKAGAHSTVTCDIGCRPCYKKFRIPDCKSLDCLNNLSARRVLSFMEGKIAREKIDVKT